MTNQANRLTPDLVRIRSTLPYEEKATKVRLRLPLLSLFLREHGMGGGDWIEQVIRGFPMIGEAGEPGVYDECSLKSRPMSRDELFETAKGRWLPEKHLMNPIGPHCGTRLCHRQRKDGCRGHIDTQKQGSFGLG